MPRRPASFRQSDLTRALKAAEAAGVRVSRMEINPDGKLVLFSGSEVTSEQQSPFDEWKAKRDAR